MKKFLAFLVATAAALALAAHETPDVTPVSEIDLLVGQSQQLIPAGPLLTGFSVEEGQDFLEVSRSGYMLVMKGKRPGDAKLRLDLRHGQSSPLVVHVKSVSVRPSGKPGETKPERPEWKGVYELRMPENHYSIICHSFNEDGRERIRKSFSCIDNLFVEGETFESEDAGYRGMSDIISMYDYGDQLGYNGGLMPNGHYKMFYGDGNEISPDNISDARQWFEMYAPPSLAEALFGSEMADFGRDNHGDDKVENGTIMQRIRMVGASQSQLKRYYRGDDIICGRKCWVFDFCGTNLYGYGGYCVWVDTETGLVLRQENQEGGGFIVTRFDLNYTDWDIEIRPDLFE